MNHRNESPKAAVVFAKPPRCPWCRREIADAVHTVDRMKRPWHIACHSAAFEAENRPYHRERRMR